MAAVIYTAHLREYNAPNHSFKMKLRPKNPDIDPADPFANDALNRRPIVEFLDALISKAEGPMVLALDSPWGTGKSTLVRMLQAQLQAKKCRTAFFNAWSVDYASDPLVALVSKIDLIQRDASEASRRRLSKLKRIATLVGKRGLIAAVKASTLGALDLDKEIEAALSQGVGDASSELFDLAMKEGECLAKFRQELEAVITETQQNQEQRNLVFFIDELDRCRPTFAIELLERIKHLFDVPNIIFVLSIDKHQLETSVSSIYGAGINSREYLRRFIDLEFQVPLASGKPFVMNLLRKFGLDELFASQQETRRGDLSTFVDVFCELAHTKELSLRTQEHCISRLAVVLDQTPPGYHLYPVLAATLIVTRAINQRLFSQIRSGTASSEELMQWLRESRTKFKPGDRVGISIESYMNAADPNETRRALRLQRLEVSANDALIEPEDRNHASAVLTFTSQLMNSFNGAPNLNYLTNKIDLADRVQG